MVNLCLIHRYGCPHASLSLETAHCLELQLKPANGRKAGLPQTHQIRAVPALQYTWQQLASPHDTDKRKIVDVVLSRISTISGCLHRGGILLISSTTPSPPSPQPYQVPPKDLGAAGITYPGKYRGYQLL